MKLIIVRGVAGSGKSTFAKKIGCFHVEADMFCITDFIYTYNRLNHKNNHDLCFELVEKILKNGNDVVVSNTFTKISEMQRYIDLANQIGAECIIVRMTNKFDSIHNVPKHIIENMYQRFENISNETFYDRFNEYTFFNQINHLKTLNKSFKAVETAQEKMEKFNASDYL